MQETRLEVFMINQKEVEAKNSSPSLHPSSTLKQGQADIISTVVVKNTTAQEFLNSVDMSYTDGDACDNISNICAKLHTLGLTGKRGGRPRELQQHLPSLPSRGVA